MSETSEVQMEIPLATDEDIVRDATTRALVSTPRVGILVTNHLNLMYMLAAGLIMPPSGFGGKHYHDTLAAFPGWLPLFVGHGRKAARAPQAAIRDATAEATHLRPVILEIDLAGLRGTVHAHGSYGWANRRIEEGIARDESLLLLPAPLPASRIRRVIFRSQDEKKATETEAANRSNVVLGGAKQTSSERFSGPPVPAWPLPNGPTDRDVALPAAQAVGGVMAVLHQLANRGELSARTCRSAFDPSVGLPGDSISTSLPDWVRNGRATGAGRPFRTGRELFWGAVDRLVDFHGQSNDSRPEDALIAFYRESSEGLGNERQARATSLLSTLESLGGGLGGSTVSEMLDLHQTPLGRAAILFLLRQRSSELLDLIGDYPQLEERDCLAAGILFGVRDGWLKLPRNLREPPELAAAVTHRMAALAHRLDGSGFDLGDAPARVRPLRELLGDPDSWSPREENAAVQIASRLEWECIRTRVQLRRGTYHLRIERESAHIDFEGEPSIKAWVDRDRFFEYLTRNRIDARTDASVRKQLAT